MENIDKEIERLENIVEKKRQDFDFLKSTSFKEFQDCAEPEASKLNSLYSVKRLTTEFILKPQSEYGDLMSFESFVEACNNKCFIDYDGYGYYATKDKQTDIVVYASDITTKIYRQDFDHVIWFNR